MAKNKKKMNWFVDLIAAAGFLIAMKPEITGLAVHEWLGLAMGGVLLVHLVLHWNWVTSVSKRIFTSISGKLRTRYLVDVGLLVGFFTIIATGIVISSIFSFEIANYTTWRFIHVLSSFATLVLFVLKIVLHWDWIANTTKYNILGISKREKPAKQAVGHLAALQVDYDPERRQFLRTVGFAGIALVFSSAGFSKWLRKTSPQETPQPTLQPQATEAQPAPSATPTTLPTSTAVENIQTTTVPTQIPTAVPTATEAVLVEPTTELSPPTCNKGCSYPGRCRRYVDNNGNNICDLSEWH